MTSLGWMTSSTSSCRCSCPLLSSLPWPSPQLTRSWATSKMECKLSYLNHCLSIYTSKHLSRAVDGWCGSLPCYSLPQIHQGSGVAPLSGDHCHQLVVCRYFPTNKSTEPLVDIHRAEPGRWVLLQPHHLPLPLLGPGIWLQPLLQHSGESHMAKWEPGVTY